MEGEDNVGCDFPRRKFRFGSEPNPSRSINYRSKTELFPKLKIFLGPDLWSKIKESPLGVVIKFYEINFVWCSRIIHHLVTKQLVTKKQYELWFLVDDTPLRFNLKEFEEVTGLSCAVLPEEHDIVVDKWEFLTKLDMPGNRVSPTLEDLCTAFASGRIKSDDDKIRVAYLVIVASVILGWDRRSPIPKKITSLVMDLEKFVAYPWGRVGFKALVAEVRRTELNRYSYVMGGFLQVLQVWAYVVIPRLGNEIGFKFSDDGPPLLQYKGSKPKVSLEDVGFVDNSGIGVDSSEWEDEVEDVQVDNIVSYYKEHKVFRRRMWGLEPTVDTKPEPKERKRKEEEDVVECNRGVKQRKVNASEEGLVSDEEFKTFLVKKLQALGDDVKALTERVGKMENEIVKINRAMLAMSATKTPIPPKSTKKPNPTPNPTLHKSSKKPPISPRKPLPTKKLVIPKKPAKPEAKKAPEVEDTEAEMVERRITRSSQVLLLTQ